MANLAMTAQEYARLKKAERAYFLDAIERSVRLIFSRDVAIAARDEYRQALDMRLVSEGSYFAQKFFQAFFSLNTLFFVLGTSIFLPYVIMWDIPSPPRDTRIVLWFILILALRSLYICIRIGAGHVVGDYGQFRAYMLKNRQEVQANWEEKCRTINRLNAQIEDEEQCIIPAAYRHAAGELGPALHHLHQFRLPQCGACRARAARGAGPVRPGRRVLQRAPRAQLPLRGLQGEVPRPLRRAPAR